MTQEKDQIPFIIALSFLAAFVLIRLGVFLAGSAQSEFAAASKVGEIPDVRFYIGRNIILFGYHIHHFYIGVLLICVAGWMAITESEALSRKQLAITYGAGLGLFFDEIGLLLTWGDYYSHLSYLLSLLVIGIFVNIIYFSRFWASVKETLVESPPSSKMSRFLFKYDTFTRVADAVSKKTGNSSKVSLIFTGILYLIISFIVLKLPYLVRYLVALVFFIHGINYILGFLDYGKSGDNYEI